jgi:hypothetical protein
MKPILPDPRLPPGTKLGLQLKPGEPIADLFTLIDVPHRHDDDKWMAFYGDRLDFVGLATLGAAKRLDYLPRWRLSSPQGADHFQAGLLDFSESRVVVSLIGFRWADTTFQILTKAGSEFKERIRKGSIADLSDPIHRRTLDS